MNKGPLLLLLLLLVTGTLTGGLISYTFETTNSESIIIKNGYCKTTDEGKEFILNIYNTGNDPIQENMITVSPMNSNIILETTNDKVDPKNLGKIKSIYKGNTSNKNFHFEIVYGDSLNRYLITC